MRRSPLAFAIALAVTGNLAAQDVPADRPVEGSVPLSYVGGNTRLSLGVDDDLNVIGEILHLFAIDDDSAWLFEGWLGNGGEGGLKLDYHFLRGDSVVKVFGAVDQNPFDDRSP